MSSLLNFTLTPGPWLSIGSSSVDDIPPLPQATGEALPAVLGFDKAVWTLGRDTVQSHMASHMSRIKLARPKPGIRVVFTAAEGIECDYNPIVQMRTVRPGETEGLAQGPTATQGQSGPWNPGLPQPALTL